MVRLAIASMAALALGAPAHSQPAAPPRPLSPTVLEPVRLQAPGPVSPAEAARQREALIKSLKEEFTTFDPTTVTAQLAEGHWQVRTGTQVLKDFGADQSSAREAVRVIRGLGVNQLGTVKGSNPPFEYWLVNGKPPRVANARVVVVPVFARSVRAENVGGTWVLTDGTKGLYDFGADGEAAQRAAAVYWKYGVNQLGVIGSPRPTMLYPLTDPTQANHDRGAPVPMPSPLGVLNDVARTSLLLPGNVYAGPKEPIDLSKLRVARGEHSEAVLAYGDEVLARFGGSEVEARNAVRALQNAGVSELARIGSTGFPLFLASGQPIHGEPLGATRTSIRADRLRTQKIRETWWVVEDNRPLVEAGTREDAELLVKVMRFFEIRSVCVMGRAETGGLPLLTVGR
jgi:hypothetical protein